MIWAKLEQNNTCALQVVPHMHGAVDEPGTWTRCGGGSVEVLGIFPGGSSWRDKVEAMCLRRPGGWP